MPTHLTLRSATSDTFWSIDASGYESADSYLKVPILFLFFSSSTPVGKYSNSVLKSAAIWQTVKVAFERPSFPPPVDENNNQTRGRIFLILCQNGAIGPATESRRMGEDVHFPLCQRGSFILPPHAKLCTAEGTQMHFVGRRCWNLSSLACRFNARHSKNKASWIFFDFCRILTCSDCK